MRSLCLCGVLTLLACFGRGEASAQNTAAEEAARCAMVIAQLPPDAAKVLFGRESTFQPVFAEVGHGEAHQRLASETFSRFNFSPVPTARFPPSAFPREVTTRQAGT